MDTISFELIKKERFQDLKPYGKFVIKWKTRQGHLPNIIPFAELNFDSRQSMPTTDAQDKEIIKFMKANKTDILVDSRGDFYTRAGRGFVQVYHKKLGLYRDDEGFRNAVDTGHSFGRIILNNA